MQVTPAKALNEKIVKAANIGEFAGEMITSVPNVPMVIPRGKYSFDMYSTFVKLHGTTNDYKILYKDINKCYLLPKPDEIHMAYILHLKAPLRMGNTQHHFIALQFEKEKEQMIKINLSKEEIKAQFDGKLQPEMDGPIYDILSQLFKNLAKVNILIPGEFRSAKGSEAIKCSVKASDGHLYPLKSSLIFIHKPIHLIKHSQIKYIEFSRLGGMGAGIPSSRSFDMKVTHMGNEPAITFAGIDKQEHKNLTAYMKSKGIKMRSVDVETNQEIDVSEGSDGDVPESDSAEPRSRGRKRQAEEEDDDESDESFKEGGGSEGEDGEQEDEDDDEDGEDESDEDADMDEGIDKDELKALQKEVEAIDMSNTTRRTRGTRGQ